jgi:hypothetical protein
LLSRLPDTLNFALREFGEKLDMALPVVVLRVNEGANAGEKRLKVEESYRDPF